MASGSSLRITSDEVVEFPCSPCAEADKMRPAVKYCVQCDEYFCRPCTDSHSNFRALRRHKLVDQDDFKSSSHQAHKSSVPREKCKKHTTKILEMFCKSHDDIGCTTCMTLDHRTCPDVLWIPDAVEKLRISSNLASIKEALVTSKTKLGQLKVIRENSLEELKTSKENAIKSIKIFREELEKFLAKLEAASLQEVDADYVAVETRLKDELQEIESQVESLEEDIMKLELKEENKAQRFVELKSAEKTQKISEQCYSELSRKPESESIAYNVNPDIKASFQLWKTFGQAKNIQKSFQGYQPSEETSTALYSVQKLTDIDCRMKNDNPVTNVFVSPNFDGTFYPFINGACFSKDGLLLVSDKKNRMLRRIDVSQQCIKDHFRFPAFPCGVCCTGSNEVVAHFGDDTLQIYSLDGIIKLTKKFLLSHGCSGLTYGNEELYISDGKSTVYVYDLIGRCLRTITVDSSSSIGKVVFDTSSGQLFICTSDGLHIYDHHGSHLATFADPLLRGITDVCTDSRGSVFVCGDESRNVVQLTKDGKWLGEVVWSTSGHLWKPLFMCFDPRSNKLCVMENPGPSATSATSVKVFDLEQS